MHYVFVCLFVLSTEHNNLAHDNVHVRTHCKNIFPMNFHLTVQCIEFYSNKNVSYGNIQFIAAVYSFVIISVNSCSSGLNCRNSYKIVLKLPQSWPMLCSLNGWLSNWDSSTFHSFTIPKWLWSTSDNYFAILLKPKNIDGKRRKRRRRTKVSLFSKWVSFIFIRCVSHKNNRQE